MNIRLNEVRKYIENHGEATVETLTELLGCSKMTVWRYLKQLEDEGSIRRVRNGAIATSLAGDTEGLYSQRMHENADAKLSIARAAIPYLVPNTSIFLDAGTTVMSLVRQLPNQHYTIVTSGANIAIELSQRSRSTVSCVGGQISSSTLSLSGPQAEAFLATVNIDTAVLAATGYSAGAGFTVGSYTENSLLRHINDIVCYLVVGVRVFTVGYRYSLVYGFRCDNVCFTHLLSCFSSGFLSESLFFAA